MASALIGPQRKAHNKYVLDELEVGDLVEFPRGPYSHWGVYVGEGQIVHLSGADDNRYGNNKADDVLSGNCFTISGVDCDKACVKKEDFWNVVEDSLAKKNNEKDKKFRPLSPREIKVRALSRLGPIPYSIIWSNCEHFAAWCRNDTDLSEQADTVLTWGVALGALAIVGGLAYAALTGGNVKRK